MDGWGKSFIFCFFKGVLCLVALFLLKSSLEQHSVKSENYLAKDIKKWINEHLLKLKDIYDISTEKMFTFLNESSTLVSALKL